MSSRLASRLLVGPMAVGRRIGNVGRRRRAEPPARVLVAHSLLLGDTLMLTALLARLRATWPDAEIVFTVAPGLLPLYQSRPFGIRAVGYDPRNATSLLRLGASTGFDLAIVPGDNRVSWAALAAGARWIVAHGGDRPGYKSWPVDELRAYPREPTALSDIFAGLADGPEPEPFRPSDWPAPACAPFALPTDPYVVLHVGAGSPLRHWPPDRWAAVARWLSAADVAVALSCGPGEEPLLTAIDPGRAHTHFPGTLSLSQLWQLVQQARLLIVPDTGISHLARLTGTPSITLYGPGSATLFGPGRFWREIPHRAVIEDPFPCRDQQTVFKRVVPWARRCQRNTNECLLPRCMLANPVDRVVQAVRELIPDFIREATPGVESKALDARR